MTGNDYSRQLAETIFISAAGEDKLAIAISALREATTPIAKFSHIEEAMHAASLLDEVGEVAGQILTVVERTPGSS